mmetsp:Transcript_45689/g.131001  ORF Transcript_45689/g.131001 Transcript_45689/m.131001 type:complete len:231 (+) Transcript_45689:58-750(+)
MAAVGAGDTRPSQDANLQLPLPVPSPVVEPFCFRRQISLASTRDETPSPRRGRSRSQSLHLSGNSCDEDDEGRDEEESAAPCKETFAQRLGVLKLGKHGRAEFDLTASPLLVDQEHHELVGSTAHKSQLPVVHATTPRVPFAQKCAAWGLDQSIEDEALHQPCAATGPGATHEAAAAAAAAGQAAAADQAAASRRVPFAQKLAVWNQVYDLTRLHEFAGELDNISWLFRD